MIENSHNYVFHKNAYTGFWHAVKSEDYFLLKNDLENPRVLKHTNIYSLLEIIEKNG